MGCPSSDHDPEVDRLKLAEGLEETVQEKSPKQSSC